MKKYLWLLAACSLAASATFSCTSSDETCVIDEVKCEEGVLFTCMGENPLFVKGEACESGICEDKVKCQEPIVSCTAGEKNCKENVYHECNATGDAWVKTDCKASNNVCDAEKACVECVVVGDCPESSIDCVDNKCVADNVVCTTGATKCLDDKLHTCADNAWGEGVACGTDKECKIGDDKCTDQASVGCLSGSTRCAEGVLQTCTEFNVWDEGIECDVDQECVDGADVCTDSPITYCLDETKKCLNNLLYTCYDKDWGEGVACEAGRECKDGGNKCTLIKCYDDATKCVDGKLYTCADNSWGEGVACDTGFVCLAGEDQCSDASAFQCAFTELTGSPETAKATGKAIVTKGTTIIAGGLYCGTSLSKSVLSWPRTSAAPTKNTDYASTDADEWQSATITNLPASVNYCTFVVQLEDESLHVCPKSATFRVPKDPADGLKLTAADVRTMVTSCGNNVIDAKEECDGTNVGSAVCGAGKTGAVTCTNQCKLNYSGCLDASIDYKYSEDFDGFAFNNQYNIDKTLTKDGKIISTQGAMYVENNVINGNTLVIGDALQGYVMIESETAGANIGIGTLSFQYRSWITSYTGNVDSFDDPAHKIEVFINNETTPVGEVLLNGKYDTVQTAVITINRDAKSFIISKKPIGGSNAPRILIDNIKWSDKK